MKQIRLAYLYPDLMNLYGDNGNLRILERELSLQSDIEVSIDRLSVTDEVSLRDYDLVYMGSGTESNLMASIKDMHRFSAELKSYIEENKLLLMTGNSFTALGKSIENADGSQTKCLGILDFTSRLRKTRDNKDVVFHLCDGKASDLAVGFINRSFYVDLSDHVGPLFEVVHGIGNNVETEKGKFEGIKYKSTYCSSITGPILVKNPWFLQMICQEITLRHGLEYVASNSLYRQKAYEMGLEGLISSSHMKG